MGQSASTQRLCMTTLSSTTKESLVGFRPNLDRGDREPAHGVQDPGSPIELRRRTG